MYSGTHAKAYPDALFTQQCQASADITISTLWVGRVYNNKVQATAAATRIVHEWMLVGVCRQQEGRASAASLADLKASAARELAEVRKQAKEQLQQSGGEAQVKLAAVQSAREALQGQVEKLQDSNGALHQQLADAHGKVCPCCSAGTGKKVVFLVDRLYVCITCGI